MSKIGTVHLVGAGPGDPELLTLRAARLLMHAELVVHDGLVDPAVLAMAHPKAKFVSVAKRRARHTLPQEEINALLVREALAGRDVVRLKGGDPFVFGRGGEEAEACRAAGVPVEIVPGVTSALGAAAAAQIPLTHRDAASVVSFVAGQCKGLSEQNWAGLAGQGRTLVIYMGVKTSALIAEKLMEDGLAPDMPVAVIENACRPDMRVLRAPLAGLPQMVEHERVKSPALIVIGQATAREDVAVGQFAAEFAPVKIITGNDLKTGAVIWWDGRGWSIHVEDAADAGDQGEQILAVEDAACRVNGGYVIEAERGIDGAVRPAHIKDRIRALGPTVRPDLTLKPADPDAGNWVI